MSVDLPTEYGGAGQSFFASILVIEAMSRIDPSVGLVLDLQNTLMNRMFLNYGTEEQKQRYLPRMAKDLVLFSLLIFSRQRLKTNTFVLGCEFLSIRTECGK